MWPASLSQLTFGNRFNQAIDMVVWRASPQHVTFGIDFIKAIGGVVWPASLQKLNFGYISNQPIDAHTAMLIDLLKRFPRVSC